MSQLSCQRKRPTAVRVGATWRGRCARKAAPAHPASTVSSSFLFDLQCGGDGLLGSAGAAPSPPGGSVRRAEPARCEPFCEQLSDGRRRPLHGACVERPFVRKPAQQSGVLAADARTTSPLMNTWLRVVQHARAPIEDDGARPPRGRALREPYLRLRLAQHFAERACQSRPAARRAAALRRRRTAQAAREPQPASPWLVDLASRYNVGSS